MNSSEYRWKFSISKTRIQKYQVDSDITLPADVELSFKSKEKKLGLKRYVTISCRCIFTEQVHFKQ